MRAHLAVAAVSIALALTGCDSRVPPASGTTVATGCPEGQSVCGTECADLKSDFAHCGSCEKQCGADEACANGNCYPKDCAQSGCNPDEVCAEGTCVAKACLGVPCPEGQQCASGVCVCATGWTDCSGTCLDLQRDSQNCGTCGKPCAASEACALGRCYPKDCAGAACEPDAVCFKDVCTAANCVGVTCPSDQECDAVTGTCASCGPLDTDQDCGACGKACAAGEGCAKGTCYPKDCTGAVCDPQSVCFNDVCTPKSCLGVTCASDQKCDAATGTCTSCGSLTTDQNCGACGKACAADQSCAQGACYPKDCATASCDPDSVCFNGSCTAKNCLGVACPSDQLCDGATGQCTSCGALTTDQNCGACGRACPADQRCADGACYPANCASATCDASAVCFNQVCTPRKCVGVSCAFDQVCDGATGTCVSCGALTTDQNCGACGRACAADLRCALGDCYPKSCGVLTCGANAVCVGGQCTDIACMGVSCGANEVCAGGVCGCANGYDRCGGTSCQPLSSDDKNCGACGHACAADQVCKSGQCACSGTLSMCGTSCADLTKDTNNCGACGKVCTATGQLCSGSACQCPSGKTVCSSACVDTTSDAKNCGSCGRVCTATGQICSAGTCQCPAGTVLCNGACIPVLADNLNCGSCGRVCPSGQYCSNGACTTPFTCQSNFNYSAVTACSLFPLDPSACGAAGARRTLGQFNTNLPGGGFNEVALDLSPSERVEVTGVCNPAGSLGGNYSLAAYNAAGAVISSTYAGCGGTLINSTFYGSPDPCAHPVKVRFTADVWAAAPNITVEAVERAGANTGGATFDAAAVIAPADGTGRVCSQICGNAHMGACVDHRYTKVVLPPNAALDLDISVNWVSTFYSGAATISAYDAQQIKICDVAGPSGGSSARGTGRIRNNTSVPQTIYLDITEWGTGGGIWNYDIALATEQ